LSLTTEQPRPDTASPDPGTSLPKVMVRTLLETVRVPDKETPAQQNERLDSAVIALMSMETQTPSEMMLAAHAVASHHATMECFRRAMLSVGNADLAVRLHRSAVTLSRMMCDRLETLDKQHARAAEDRQQRNRGGKTP
jgi:hypothetical protein